MAVDSNGITYAAYGIPGGASGSTVTAVGPDGSVIYKASFKYLVSFIAPGKDGTLWAVSDTIYQVDGQGNVSPINYPYAGFRVFAVSSDAGGNLFIAGNTPSSISIIKLSAAGAVVGVFSMNAYGSITAIAVDGEGAVYATGAPAPGFKATPGALQTSVPNLGAGTYLLKVASALDHVVYATFLCQG
jgi:hypothetical protein